MHGIRTFSCDSVCADLVKLAFLFQELDGRNLPDMNINGMFCVAKSLCQGVFNSIFVLLTEA